MFGGAVDWKATKQKTVTTSTTEAGLLALSSIGSSSYWWRRLFSSLEFETNLIPTVFCDNKQSVRIENSESESLEAKLGHMDIHQLWIRQEVEKGKMIVKWIPTSEQQADGFTKLIPKRLFQEFVNQLGLQDPSGALEKK
ncbi:hypothetical protein K3495_g7792 [Podosphaera aphanis]|nr:hypothetical protein K3495_g7792 [Podosphaera aphanis]